VEKRNAKGMLISPHSGNHHIPKRKVFRGGNGHTDPRI
jgi:hypothetical protein